MQLAQRVNVAGSRAIRTRPTRAAVVVRASAAERPVWFPGNPAPAHLDGKLAGDYGFDPLSLGSEPDNLRWYVQAELVHGRWAMLATAGILFTALGAQLGLPFPQWYEAGEAALGQTPTAFPFVPKIPYGTLVLTTFLPFAWVEMKRFMDFKNPGSQGDGSFLGVTEEFKGKENGYPGGRFFDPMGLSRGDPKVYQDYKQKEIKNGRLAMIAQLGFWSQYAATGKGPVQNLADHLADPTHVTFATNGVSVPFLSN